MQLSIILPIYNVADYLPRCLESIRQQELPEDGYEIIAVDDGSTDETPAILKRLQREIANLDVIRQPNSGPSVARNTGMEYARGRYIFFVDPDDYLAPGALKTLYDQLEKHTEDVVGFRYMRVDESGRLTPYHSLSVEYGRVWEGTEFLRAHNVIGVVWAYLFRRDFLREQRLRMIPGIYHQDEEFVVRALFFARRVVLLDLLVYYYFKRSTSTVNRSDRAHRERLIRDSLTVISSLVSLRDSQQDAEAVLHRKLSFLTLDVIRLLIREGHSELFIREVTSRLREMALYPLPAAPYGMLYRLFRLCVGSPACIVLLAKTDARYFPPKRRI